MAKCLVAPKPVTVKTVVVVKDVVGDKRETQNEELRDLDHKKKMKSLEKDIQDIEKRVAPVTKTPEQILEEEIEEGLKLDGTHFLVEQRLKAKADAKYPKGSIEHEREYARIDAHIRKHMD